MVICAGSSRTWNQQKYGFLEIDHRYRPDSSHLRDRADWVFNSNFETIVSRKYDTKNVFHQQFNWNTKLMRRETNSKRLSHHSLSLVQNG